MENSRKGWLYGGMGVVIFAGSLPATRLAVQQLSAYAVTGVRGVLAGVIALVLLTASRQALPQRSHWRPLVVVAAGVVFGFPLLTALALEHVSSVHSIVFLGLLPLCTAIFGAMREHSWPRPIFWVFACSGSACVGGFSLLSMASGNLLGDLFMLAAVIVCGLGYAEGAILSRMLGGWQVICWALVISLPLMLPLLLGTYPFNKGELTVPTVLAITYVTLFSTLIGFFFWYQGLALGGTARIGQLQLLQPFIALGMAALVLQEPVTPSILVATTAALLCVVGIKRYA